MRCIYEVHKDIEDMNNLITTLEKGIADTEKVIKAYRHKLHGLHEEKNNILSEIANIKDLKWTPIHRIESKQ
jgi:hypothetical protein